jgi:hypothetical protein
VLALAKCTALDSGDLESYLGRLQLPEGLSVKKLNAMRARLWQQQGLILLDPMTIADKFVRQEIINDANERYGKR